MSTLLGRRVYLAAFVLPLVGLLPGSAWAQGKARNFEELQGRVMLGENVKVVNRDGAATRGRLLRLTSTDLTLVANNEREQTIAAGDVVEVKARRSGPLWNGAVIGAAAVLIPAGIAIANYECGNCALGVALWTGIGAVAGVGIDALVKGDITVMKLESSGRPGRSFTVAPLLQRDRRGVLCQITF